MWLVTVSYGAMTETRETLEARKRELFDAIRTLERDCEDGTIDDEAYRRARGRFESEAALVEEHLDRLQDETPPGRAGTTRLTWLAAPAGGLVLAAVVLFLLGALHPRAANGTVTGDVPTALPLSSAIQVAERSAAAHPRSVDAQITLGNAYLDAGKDGLADRSYRAAMRLAPSRPEAPTLHAMVLGVAGKTRAALRQLGLVEHAHPTYARAWLLDGLLSSKSRAGYPRARRAWSVFLRLNPRGAVPSSVRTWLKALK